MSDKSRVPPCRNCVDSRLDIDFTMAFQPIVDVDAREIFAYEALARGLNQEGAGAILSQVNDDNRYAFDQSCRRCAIELAASLGMTTRLSINFLPNAIYEPAACLRTTLAAAEEFGFDRNRIILEVTESEKVRNQVDLVDIINVYRDRGLVTAIDDFGAGYAGLNLLADFQPDIIKLDMKLIRNIDSARVNAAIVDGISRTARDLDIEMIAEGVETAAEMRKLRELGITLMQGYHFARPGFESLPEVDWDTALAG